MTVQAGDIIRCTQEMTYETFGAIQNVYHLQNVGSQVTDTQALDDVIEILETLAGVIAAAIAILQVVNGVRVVNVTQLADVGFASFVDDTPFTGAGLILPTQVAVGINLFTDRLAVVGRKYFGAAVIGTIADGGTIVPGILADLADWGDLATEWLAATNSTWQMGVVATFDSAWLPFRNYSMPTMAIIQRRRRLGVGI